LKLTQREFADRAGVSKQAISKKVYAGSLVRGEDGKLDTEDPTNAEYLAGRNGATRAAVSDSGASEKPEPASVDGLAKAHANGQSNAGAVSTQQKKLEADIERVKSQTRLNVIKAAESVGQLIHRDVVQRAFAAFDGQLQNQFLSMPRRIAPQIMAMVQSGCSEQELVDYIAEEVQRGIEQAKEASESIGPESL
jgi:transcriptional regulator with XRE-family HTH domain